MSMMRCEHHDYSWDSDKLERCPRCSDMRAQLRDKLLVWIDELTDGEVNDMLRGACYPWVPRFTVKNGASGGIKP